MALAGNSASSAPGTGQALRYNARERRLSLAGVPELSRTHRFAIPTASIAAGQFPAAALSRPVTFWTGVRFGAGAHSGLVFEFGNATAAIALYVDGQVLTLRAGSAAAGDFVEATYDRGAAFPEGLRLDLVAAVHPGTGRARLWANGLEVARGEASGGALPAGWAASSTGAFAAAAQGALPADVTQTGAPANFAVVRPLSAYVGQAPRHFV